MRTWRNQAAAHEAIRRATARHLAVLLFGTTVLASSAGCWLGRLQTARTTPKGHIRLVAGQGFLSNELIDERSEQGTVPVGFGNFPTHLGVRLGLTDRLDVGLVEYGLAGMQADVKVNLLPPSWNLALALSGGFGAAADLAPSGGGYVVLLPVTLFVSYDFFRGHPTRVELTPYGALGWTGYWIWGYEPDEVPQGFHKGDGPTRGDHVLQVTAGLAVSTTEQTRLFLEYDYMHQFYDDVGDNHAFVDNHLFLVGVSIDIHLGVRRPPRALAAGHPGP